MSTCDVNKYSDVINELSSSEKSPEVLEKLTSAFRSLRNLCAMGCDMQNSIASDDKLLKSTSAIFNNLMNNQSDEANLCIQIGLQFLGNLLVGNHEIQSLVWQSFQHELHSCLRFDHVKIQNCTAMILYNIFLSHPEYMSHSKQSIQDIISLMNKDSSSEFALYLLQLFMSKTDYIQECYSLLDDDDDRLTVIEAAQDLIKESESAINLKLVQFLADRFLNSCDEILSIAKETSLTIEVFETVKILELLASCTSNNETMLSLLQNNSCLLIKSSLLLRSIHDISKQSDNNFSMIQKISELSEIEKDKSVQDHPYFGFKSSLIRLIGNLCWKNKANQDKIRELECIPVFLDCCNIDGRNPFVTQWCILAIRNICENNHENQQFIAAMPRTGTIDVEKLQKMGILLNKDGDGSTLSISPLELTK